jgi:hypothetical protein
MLSDRTTPPRPRTNPHRRQKPGYKSPSTISHSKSRMNQYVLLMDNFETLTEFYGVDTPDEQYVIQNFYHRFENIAFFININ